MNKCQVVGPTTGESQGSIDVNDVPCRRSTWLPAWQRAANMQPGKRHLMFAGLPFLETSRESCLQLHPMTALSTSQQPRIVIVVTRHTPLVGPASPITSSGDGGHQRNGVKGSGDWQSGTRMVNGIGHDGSWMSDWSPRETRRQLHPDNPAVSSPDESLNPTPTSPHGGGDLRRVASGAASRP
ncbi:hypothetical protein VTI74DRAFT_2965 [Chaetomium olivicolor]